MSNLNDIGNLREVRHALITARSGASCVLGLLRTFAGVLPCPPGKNSYVRHFKGKHGKLYIVGKLNKCRFRKKYELLVVLIPQKEIAKMTAKMTIRHSVKQMN